MLPITLPQDKVDLLMSDAEKGLELEINLPDQLILRQQGGEAIPFEIKEFRKHCLVNGLDEIGLTMQKGSLISAFEKKMSLVWPWLDGWKKEGGIKMVDVDSPALKRKIAADW
jgi:3-isopropylmalate dehydratase small subunit